MLDAIPVVRYPSCDRHRISHDLERDWACEVLRDFDVVHVLQSGMVILFVIVGFELFGRLF